MKSIGSMTIRERLQEAIDLLDTVYSDAMDSADDIAEALEYINEDDIETAEVYTSGAIDNIARMIGDLKESLELLRERDFKA